METSAIPGWSDFFTAAAGVAGALAGLVFVGLSINLTRILQLPSAIGRATVRARRRARDRLRRAGAGAVHPALTETA